MVTEKEFESLPARLQEQVRRYATSAGGAGWQQYYSPQVAPTQFRRVGECAPPPSSPLSPYSPHSRLPPTLAGWGEVNLCADDALLFLLLLSCGADWLRERVFFDKLSRKDGYAKARLGFSAPNIFVLSLSNY